MIPAQPRSSGSAAGSSLSSPAPPAAKGGRLPKQLRSARRQQQIIDAAIAVIAEQGLARLTHRLIAQRAGLSLAATTYHYGTKHDIVAAASQDLLSRYVATLRRFAERWRGRPGPSFREFAWRLITNAIGRHRLETLAWCEIMLAGAREPETRRISRRWFETLLEMWSQVAKSLGAEDPRNDARSAIDVVIGIVFVILPLGLTHSQVAQVIAGGADPAVAWRPAEAVIPIVAPAAPAAKLTATRARILEAAGALLMAEGPAAVTYRAVAAASGLTAAAPTYYFATIESLIHAAQARLFEQSKHRYREVVAGLGEPVADLERMIDVTSAVFVREATEFSLAALAGFLVRLEAARTAHLRPIVWSMVEDQHRAWSRLFALVEPQSRPIDPLLAQCLFAGKLVRQLATGAETLDLAAARGEFARDFRAMEGGSFWAQTGTIV
jgi:AcrR family transcriptional regulator